MKRKAYIPNLLLLAGLLLLLGLSQQQPLDPVYMVVVTSNDPTELLWVAVEDFRIDGERQSERQRQTPFAVEMHSKNFEVAFRRIEGDTTFLATLMRRHEGAWYGGGLAGGGERIKFVLTDSTGRVGPGP